MTLGRSQVETGGSMYYLVATSLELLVDVPRARQTKW